MNKTKIEWADSTWNPVTGCYHTCEYCYARRIANRYGGCSRSSIFGTYASPGQFTVGDMDTKSITGYADYPKLFEMYKPASVTTKEGDSRLAPYPFYFNPTLHRYRLDEPQRKTKPQTIFVCSMADLFGAWVPDEWIEAVFEACEKAPQHRYLFLTKNPQRYIDLSESGRLLAKNNMWYGTTVTKLNEPFFWSIDRHTFVSIEPIMEDFTKGIIKKRDIYVEWVIVGAETGNRKNKVIPKKEWIDAIAEKCDSSNINLFLKDSLIPIVGEENMRREFPWD